MKYAQINWAPMKIRRGGGGTIFAIGMLILIGVAFPYLLKLMLPFMALGALGGVIAYWWRNR